MGITSGRLQSLPFFLSSSPVALGSKISSDICRRLVTIPPASAACTPAYPHRRSFKGPGNAGSCDHASLALISCKRYRTPIPYTSIHLLIHYAYHYFSRDISLSLIAKGFRLRTRYPLVWKEIATSTSLHLII
ncbi:hypothetical protein K491DRAFT_98738 [Lophiostoma macrostomum CBS 122681]|uniref:Uncharacterized protein n=1 Tax=Lophiostoma macrostomum CBS 122681 TaxID=1314788 RepID=A0A6A6SU60_9PLEO|nr:hypothetical protein K491DRAFT_98738 [Lophiostoma macrostomum CBS 122681]